MNKLFNGRPLVVDKHLAALLGLNEALILQQVHYWVEINRKNNRHCHGDRYWTYNTIHEWQAEFPFWSVATVKRTFKKLREMGLIMTDNFNVFQMDRTLWYTINYDELQKLMIESGNPTDDAALSTEGYPMDSEDQTDEMIGSVCVVDEQENDPMDGGLLTLAIPEISTEISSNISNPSISPSKGKEEKRQRDGSANEFEIKYARIMENCEISSIDEEYREAVAHAIRLLLLDIGKNNRIKIGDHHIPAKMVEKDIQKLNYFTVEHAVNKFKEICAKIEIRNAIAYLKTCIYNAINEMRVEVDSKLRYVGLI